MKQQSAIGHIFVLDKASYMSYFQKWEVRSLEYAVVQRRRFGSKNLHNGPR
jgi:hypothetical protein